MHILHGVVTFKNIGMGCWEFTTTDGKKYELVGGTDELFQDGRKAVVKGTVRNDLMSAGNIGPIFEVDSVEG